MTKKKGKNKKVLTIFLIAIFAVFTIVLFKDIPDNNKQEDSSTQNRKEVISDFMNFKVTVPQEAIVENELTTFNVIFPTGNITFNRNGTDHGTVNEYVDNLQEMNSFKLKNKQNTTVSSHKTISGYTSDPNNLEKTSKLYFIFVNGIVFTLSTSSPDLYDELDTIAHSFQYTGN